ncbi:MAG: hypothetical protein AAB403_20990 [Planctomycetota bacterium]
MARGKNLNDTVKVQPTVSLQTFDYLNQLVAIGNYGNTPTNAAGYLIQRGIDDMLRAKLLDKIRKRPKRR